MRIDNPLLKGFCFAANTEAGEGGISDDEVAAADAGVATSEAPEEEVSTDDDGGGEEVEDAGDDSLASRVAEKIDLAKAWESHGITGLPTDPNELVSRVQAAQRYERDNEQLRQQLIWQANNYAQSQRPAPVTEKPKPVFNLPEFEQAWLQMVTTDENGNLVSKNGADPSLPSKIQAFARAKEEEQLRLLRDPVGVLEPAMMPIFEQRLEQRIQQAMTAYDRRAQCKAFEKENASWVFNNGADIKGGITPAAETFNRYYAEAEQFGHNDPLGYARSRLDAEILPLILEQQQAAAKKAAESTPKQKDRQFLANTAKKQSNRGGAQPNGTTKNVRPEFSKAFDKLRQRIKDVPDEDFEMNESAVKPKRR